MGGWTTISIILGELMRKYGVENVLQSCYHGLKSIFGIVIRSACARPILLIQTTLLTVSRDLVAHSCVRRL